MDKYVCGPCGYVYDPAEGDADGGIDAGTAFADLPEDWVCPVCGAAKDEFEKEQSHHGPDLSWIIDSSGTCVNNSTPVAIYCDRRFHLFLFF